LTTVAQAATVPEILIPECPKGIGRVILAPEAKDLIGGVRIAPSQLFADDRGYFQEIGRMGQGLISDYPASCTQVSSALTYPGAIKAFHFHRHQTDVWAVVHGMLQVVLVDLRAGSPTHGLRNTAYVGTLRPWQILIPPGVAHGYKVIGIEPAILVYLTNRFYNPDDEGRIPHDHAGINYDWELQHK
jgi:dTDP-4-dehydrorhamnose 3,5-epimerase